jgi:hypothetical protein
VPTAFHVVGAALFYRANWQTPRSEAPMSNTEPEQNSFARTTSPQVSLRPISFGKIAAAFLVVGPPLFGALFWLAVSLANPVGDPLHEKIGVAFGVAFSFFGLLASYAVGLLPSLIICTAFAKCRQHIRSTGIGLIVAALIGASVYSLVFVLGFDLLTAGRMEGAYWLFTFYAAAAGAVSAFICAFIAENFLAKLRF